MMVFSSILEVYSISSLMRVRDSVEMLEIVLLILIPKLIIQRTFNINAHVRHVQW